MVFRIEDKRIADGCQGKMKMSGFRQKVVSLLMLGTADIRFFMLPAEDSGVVSIGEAAESARNVVDRSGKKL
jgi:hypothetical protein